MIQLTKSSTRNFKNLKIIRGMSAAKHKESGNYTKKIQIFIKEDNIIII